MIIIVRYFSSITTKKELNFSIKIFVEEKGQKDLLNFTHASFVEQKSLS